MKADGFESDGEHDTEVEIKVNFNSIVPAELSCRRQREKNEG